MAGKSTDINAKDAAIKVIEMESVDDILAYIEGDERKVVLGAADKWLRELGHEGLKQGETGAITQEAGDFKEGVQATKDYVTGEDVLRKLRAKGTKI